MNNRDLYFVAGLRQDGRCLADLCTSGALDRGAPSPHSDHYHHHLNHYQHNQHQHHPHRHHSIMIKVLLHTLIDWMRTEEESGREVDYPSVEIFNI